MTQVNTDYHDEKALLDSLVTSNMIIQSVIQSPRQPSTSLAEARLSCPEYQNLIGMATDGSNLMNVLLDFDVHAVLSVR